MCYRTGKYTVCRRVPASFSPEMLQAGAVEGLTALLALLLVRVLCNVCSAIIITIITVFIVTCEDIAKIFPFGKQSLGIDAKVDGWTDDAWMKRLDAALADKRGS